MSFRNRCVIAGGSGAVNLSIPLVDGRDQRRPLKEVRIDNKTDWQGQHWKTITSCYNRSPWFEFYKHELEILYRRPTNWLVDWNRECWDWVVGKLGLEIETRWSDGPVGGGRVGILTRSGAGEIGMKDEEQVGNPRGFSAGEKGTKDEEQVGNPKGFSAGEKGTKDEEQVGNPRGFSAGEKGTKDEEQVGIPDQVDRVEKLRKDVGQVGIPNQPGALEKEPTGSDAMGNPNKPGASGGIIPKDNAGNPRPDVPEVTGFEPVPKQKFGLPSEQYLDWRNKLLPKSIATEFPEPIRYRQVFEDRIGFLPHLSILDLLFCEGRRTVEILKSAKIPI